MAADLAAIGIANQRETCLLWDASTGKSLGNAIVWQCRRTAGICRKLRKAGLEKEIRERTGLLIDPYFSATKLMWFFDTIPGLRRRAENGEICFGTVDSWILYHLTGLHITEPSNASRTMLFNIHKGEWDEEIIRELRIPWNILPSLVPSAGKFGLTKKITGHPLPVTGVAGDQQAALFGQKCHQAGSVKNTYGTGCFLLMHTGKNPVRSKQRLLTTVAWDLGTGLEYALEGSVFVAGAALQWLRDGLGLFSDVAASAALAGSVADTGGVVFVPAFVGLGAPHWNSDVRGTVVGLTRGSGRAHLTRAALESIAFQTKDLMTAVEKDSGRQTRRLKVDGGASRNDFLMQFQADILGVPVERSRLPETTAWGAALLAGLGAGVIANLSAIEKRAFPCDVFSPQMDPKQAAGKLNLWKKALAAAKTFAGS